MAFRQKGRGVKCKLRTINLKRDKMGTPGKVVNILYAPNHSVHLALIRYTDGEKRYILAPSGLQVGDTTISGASAKLEPGNVLPLKSIPEGTIIHNIESKPGKGGQLVRTAGGSAQVITKNGDYALVRLPSGKLRQISINCLATIGQIRDRHDHDMKPAETLEQSRSTPETVAEVEVVPAIETMPVSIAEEAPLSLTSEEINISPVEVGSPSATTTETSSEINIETSEGVTIKPTLVVPQSPTVSAQLTVFPSSGPPGTNFKASITGNPKQRLIIHGKTYSPNSGWQSWHKEMKTDKQGKASLALSWAYEGEYNIWAMDKLTGRETKPVTVNVR